MSDKKHVLRICPLVLLTIILGTYGIIKIQTGCYSGATSRTNRGQKFGRENNRLESEDADVSPALAHQEPENAPNLAEWSVGLEIKQVSELPKTPVFLLPAIAHQNEPIALIVVPEEDTCVLAVVAPVAARIRQVNKTPILLALAAEPTREQTLLLNRLAPFSGSCTILTSDPNLFWGQEKEGFITNIVPTTSDLMETSLLLARHYWQKTDLVVIAYKDDPAAAILGSTLASHLAVPFIPITGQEDPNVFSKEFETLDVKRVLFTISDVRPNPSFLDSLNQEIDILDIPSIQKRLVKQIGDANVQNLILFRVPSELTGDGTTSWLAPYLSLMRGAPVVPCYSPDPLAAEENTKRLIEVCLLKPRTVTILADYDSIGVIMFSEATESEEYELMFEPCSRPVEGVAAEMGVGRIPFRELWAASTLLARGISKDFILGQEEPKVLMIANPRIDYGPLPLCETISRATAKEFINLGIHMDEFYGVPCHDIAIQKATGNSQLIIFEGHITDFTLFEEAPLTASDELYVYATECEDKYGEGFIEVLDSTNYHIDNPVEEDPAYDESAEYNPGIQLPTDKTDSNYQVSDANLRLFPYRLEQQIEPYHLDGIPLVILQSCHSLDDSASDILAAGSVGIVGSVTNIHSASGSAFIKAFCDGFLYRGDTMGEALRDARNYLLCVAELKTKREHTQQAKVSRAAYGFGLWGDPEIKLFDGLHRRPQRRTVSASFVEGDKIRIVVPKMRLPTSRTREYFLRMFPGSEVAGIVKRLKHKDMRRVMPIYFFRIPKPESFVPLQYTSLQESDGKMSRSVFLADSFERFLYILYFPSKEKKGQEFTLQFVK